MEKPHEKKNFGIPVTILVVFAYLIGYALSKNLSGTFIAALLFAGAVFAFDFDDRVKNAVKHSYVFAIGFQLIFFMFEFFSSFFSFIFGSSANYASIKDIFFSVRFFRNFPVFLISFVVLLVNTAVIVVYALCIIMALMGKDVKFGIIARILGEAPAKDTFGRPGNYRQNMNSSGIAGHTQQEPSIQPDDGENPGEPDIQVHPPYIQSPSEQESVLAQAKQEPAQQREEE